MVHHRRHAGVTASILAGVLLLAAPRSTVAQTTDTTAFDAFPNVEYLGGHAGLADRKAGVLVFRDSALAFYRCRIGGCVTPSRGRVLWADDGPWLVLPYAAIAEVVGEARTRAANATERILLGTNTSERTEYVLTITVQSADDVEVPVFLTKREHLAVLEAKLRLRMKRATAPRDSTR